MSPRILAALSLLAVLPSGAANAFDADPDPAFGTAGKVTVNFDVAPPLGDTALAVFEGLDGAGTWVIGSAANGPTSTELLLAVTRINAAGSQIFKRTIPIDLDAISAAAPAPGGGAFAFANGPGTSGTDNVLIKLTPAGNLDTTFSGDGIYRLGLTAGAPLDVIVEPDGTVDVLYFNGPRRQLTRISPTGVPQSTRVLDTADTSSSGKLELQRDGKVLVVLGEEFPASCALRIFRYLPASQGTPLAFDPVFGSTPTTITAAPCSLAPRDMRVDPLGRIVVIVATSQLDVLVRYQPSGALDPPFGGGGPVAINTSSGRFYALGIQADSRIVIAGSVDNGIFRQASLCRLSSVGVADPSFNNGAYCTNLRFNGTGGQPSSYNVFYDIAIVGGNRILAAGAMQWAFPTDNDFAVARLKGSDELFSGGFE